MNDISSVTNPANPAPGTSSYSTFDLFGTYFLNDELQLRAGLNNLTNKGPLPVATSEIGTNPYVYNLLGRTYYVGLHFSL
jgi:outer membrane receptor protein involved in Fe transport